MLKDKVLPSFKGLTFRKISTSEPSLTEISQFLTDVFGSRSDLSVEYITWLYAANPRGAVKGYNAYSASHELVAHYALVPVVANLFGRCVKVGLSLNTATAKSWQGMGLFPQLAELSYDLAIEEGFEAVIGVANANSVNGFTTRLGFENVCVLEARVCFLEPPEGSVNSFKDLDFACLYEKEAMLWRLQNPQVDYFSSRYSRSASRSAYGVFEILMTFNEAARNNVPEKRTFFPRPKVWIGKSDWIDWSGTANFLIPDSLKPAPLHFIFKDLINSRKLSSSRMHFESIDFDVF